LEDVLKIGINLLDQVELMHSSGFMHCDIKIDNVMIDFESSQQLRESHSRMSSTDAKFHLVDFGCGRKFEIQPKKHVENSRNNVVGN
jgi:serine/threonine protein kinase